MPHFESLIAEQVVQADVSGREIREYICSSHNWCYNEKQDGRWCTNRKGGERCAVTQVLIKGKWENC